MCVCVCVCVCPVNSAIAPNKKGTPYESAPYGKDQRLMGKIFKKANKWFVPKLRLFPVYTVHSQPFCYISEHVQRATCILEIWDRQ